MRTRLSLGLAAVSGILLATAGWADEQKIPLDKVPAAVLKAVKEKFPKGEIKEAAKEVEDGKTTFEVTLKEAGHNIDVAVKEDGTIVEIEAELSVSDLPKVIVDAVKARYPKGTIKKAEAVTVGDKKTFELHVADGDKKRELVIDPNGKVVEDEDDDD
jgi:uncharacterized membrane protein YkoI